MQAKRTCSHGGCTRKHYGHGRCKLHYDRWKRGATEVAVYGDDLLRFLLKVRLQPNGCWYFNGHHHKGYARFRVKVAPRTYRTVPAHRWWFEFKHGPVPPDKHLDHFHCEDRGCVNDEHVRPATPRENTLRSSIAPAALNAAKTHCKHGHRFDEANTYHHPSGERRCRRCNREWMRQKAMTLRGGADAGDHHRRPAGGQLVRVPQDGHDQGPANA